MGMFLCRSLLLSPLSPFQRNSFIKISSLGFLHFPHMIHTWFVSIVVSVSGPLVPHEPVRTLSFLPSRVSRVQEHSEIEMSSEGFQFLLPLFTAPHLEPMRMNNLSTSTPSLCWTKTVGVR